jgi:LPXTG-motif cell wall-anchored protein
MTGSDSNTHVTVHGAAGWRDIRTLGPLLLIVFGLVLVFAPMTTIGAAGSVGNAGNDGGSVPGCPTQDQIDSLIEQRLAYEANPDNYIGLPMTLEQIADLVENCSCDEPHSPGGGNAGNAAIVDPCDRPDVEPPAEPEEPEEPEEHEPPTEPEENEPPTEPDDNGHPTDEPADHEPAAPVAAEPSEPEAAAPMDELPETGNGGQIATTAVGFLLSALGVVLLVSSRRRAVTP